MNELLLEIYRNSGRLLKTGNLEVRATVNKYLKAGFEIINNGEVSNDIKIKLQMDLVSPEKYVKMLGL